ncbi:MAG: transporter [Nitrospirota bacterium]
MFVWCSSIFLLFVFYVNPAFAHEPIFSVGPETIYRGGLGIEAEIEHDRGDNKRETAVDYEIIFGITEDISLTARLPYIIEKRDNAKTSQGIGEAAFRGKYQVYKKDRLGAQDKVALIYGLKIPTGDKDKTPPLGSGSFDHIFGISLGHESTTLYGFATGRYLLNSSSDNKDKGDRVIIDIAFGFRPWLRPYRSWDFVLLIENSYIVSYKDEINGIREKGSGGEELFSGPTFLWSIRNLMVKGGIQFSIWEDLNGNQDETDFRSVIAVEYHN